MRFMKALFANYGREYRRYQHSSMIWRVPKPYSNKYSQTYMVETIALNLLLEA